MRGPVLALVLALSPIAAIAAEPAPPGPEALSLGRQLIQATGEAADFSARLDETVAPLVDDIAGNLPLALQAQKATVAGVLEQEMKAVLPRMVEAGAVSYATTLTPEELRALIAFYQSPVGRAIAAKQTPINRQMSRETDKLKSQVLREVLVGVCARMTCPSSAKRQIEAMTGV